MTAMINEERPCFWTSRMGSLAYACQCAALPAFVPRIIASDHRLACVADGLHLVMTERAGGSR